MGTLVTRPGDLQALKGAAAAAVAGVGLTVLSNSDACSIPKLVSGSTGVWGAKDLFLLTPSGETVTEANAIARYLGEPSASPAHLYNM
jgi:hypothetical protein